MFGLGLLAAMAYWPGLKGGFLFDDFVNLDALGATGPVRDLPSFWRYLTSGTADPLGRPLSLLTILVDARDWPADPAPFLRTNLVLHLGIGVLLWRLLALLGREFDPERSRRTEVAAALGAGFWLLHPLFVSTTLYVVQREAMLPAAFVLAGLIGFVAGRNALLAGQPVRGMITAGIGIGAGTALAMLCKANGALLPLLALVLEACLPAVRAAKPADAARWRSFCLVFLWLPGVVLLAYLASFLPQLGSYLPHRGWTIGERLLTEGRVLCDYLRLLVIPRSVSTGLYNDDYVVSRGLFTPATTLPCALLAVALPVGAFCLRRRLPSLAIAVLFFFVGHLLESSVVPHELYFEHRNYLPAMLLGWPLAQVLAQGRLPARSAIVIAATIVALLGATTWQRAVLWGQPARLAALWAERNPDSSRAQATMAMMEVEAGRADAAVARLERVRRAHSADLQLDFNWVNATCATGGLLPGQAEEVENSLAQARGGLQLVPTWLERMFEAASGKQCAGLDLLVAERWLAAYSRNPLVSQQAAFVQDLEPLAAQFALARGDGDAALAHFNAALDAYATPDVAARQASMLASAGMYRQALAHLDRYESLRSHLRAPGRGMPRLHAWVLARQGYWPREMSILRAKLQAEIERNPAPQETSP
jgi:hypothetical protein